MAVNREKTARQYLDQHRIPEMLQRFTELLLYHQPDHPSTFLIEELKKLQGAPSTMKELPCLFDSSNIEAIFGVLDPCARGYITLNQYTQGTEGYHKRVHMLRTPNLLSTNTSLQLTVTPRPPV